MSTNTNSDVAVAQVKKFGRKPIAITWPDEPFTTKQVKELTGLSTVTVHKKLHEAVLENVIVSAGKIASRHGRPTVVFQRAVQSVPVAVNESNNEASVQNASV